jgi:hypothetical protein
LSLGSAVDWTATWYREQLAGKDASELCVAQIGRYFATGAVQAAA